MENLANKNLSPQGKFLTVEELFTNRNNCETNSIKNGLKKTVPDNSKREIEEIEKLQNELKALISRPRIERLIARTLGEWDPEKKLIKIIRKVGKFQAFGHVIDGDLYLNNYEALFLIELNRLELYFGSVIVSIEQAYSLLLGEGSNHNIYLIYSIFSRSGYNILPYKNVSYSVPTQNPEDTLSDVDVIFEILLKLNNSEHQIPLRIQNYTNFQSIQNSMKEIKEKIKNPCSSKNYDQEENFFENFVLNFNKRIVGKRKLNVLDNKKEAKKMKFEPKNGSFLNMLTNEPEYKKFEHIFKELQITELRSIDCYDKNCNELEIQFDLYLSNKMWKKSCPGPPNYRVIILNSTDLFPDRSQLAKISQNQLYKAPILVVSVSDSKHIQAFLYYFT